MGAELPVATAHRSEPMAPCELRQEQKEMGSARSKTRKKAFGSEEIVRREKREGERGK